MKSLRRNSKGFSVVEFMIIVLVVGVLGFVAYKFNDRQQTANDQTISATKESKAPSVNDVPSTVKDAGDLADMEALLNQSDTDVDLSSLDKDLNSF